MKKLFIQAALIFSLILISVSPVFCQQPIPIGPGDGDATTTPIGGLAVLAALGGGYAIKKLRDNSRES